MENGIDKTAAQCESSATICDALSDDSGLAISENKASIGATVMTVIAAAGAEGCCRKEKKCSNQYFDCNDTDLTPPGGGQVYRTIHDVPKTSGSTQTASAIERDTESAFSFLSGDLAKGASLLIAPWLILAIVTKAQKGGVGEKFIESSLLALWGAAFLLIADDANSWMVPVILTAFVSAGAALTNHKKKIIFVSELAALLYMLTSMGDK